MTTATRTLKPAAGVRPHIVTREFAAARDLVWDVCTKAEHLINWFAPEGRTAFIKTIDLRPGGVLHYGNRADDGSGTIWGRATYLEIDPKDRIVFLQSFSDEHGGLGTHPMAPGWPQVMYCMYRFDDLGDRTLVTIEWTPAEGTPADAIAMFDGARAGMDGGWKGTLDKLESYLMIAK